MDTLPIPVWTCSKCTYCNIEQLSKCQMCFTSYYSNEPPLEVSYEYAYNDDDLNDDEQDIELQQAIEESNRLKQESERKRNNNYWKGHFHSSYYICYASF